MIRASGLAVACGLLVASRSTGSVTISQLADPLQPQEAGHVDILSSWIEQEGGLLTFVIETREPIPTTPVPTGEDHITWIWLIDADNDPCTGQPHENLGSEFNVRVVLSEKYGGGFVDVTGTLPGGGIGTVGIDGRYVRLTIGLGQIANPSTFHWAADACHAVDNMCVTANHQTAVAAAIPLPYTAPARVTLIPPLLQLSPSARPTGQLQVEIRTADGQIRPSSEYHLSFRSSDPVAATVDGAGLVTATSPFDPDHCVSYVEARADGVPADNAAVVRITATDLDLYHETYAGSHIAFYVTPQIEGVDLDEITNSFQMVAATDLAYEAEQAATGTAPFRSGTQYLVLEVTDDANTAICGISGNPIRLGWQFGKPVHNSCYIINWPPRVPQWGVIFHEMGHNFTSASRGFGQFCSTGGPQDWVYNEALATLAGLWAWRSMERCPSTLGKTTVADLERDYQGARAYWLGRLDDYRAGGSRYDELDADVLNGLLCELYDSYGRKVWYDLFSTFTPADQPLPVLIDTPARQATWFVAAISASTGEDLRATFRNDSGFPIDDTAWDEMLAATETRIANRPWSDPIHADFDCDGDVDLNDFAQFQVCFNGPGQAPGPDCNADADFDDDGDVDVNDFAALQICFNGSNRPPACPY